VARRRRAALPAEQLAAHRFSGVPSLILCGRPPNTGNRRDIISVRSRRGATDYGVTADGHEAIWREIRSRHPRLLEALAADARVTAQYRGERHEFRGPLDLAVQILRLAWVSDAFLAQALYRAKARLQALGVPILPRIAHRLSMAIAQVSIGDPVVVHPGVYIVHGQFVADGLVEIHPGAMIFPWVTIGLRAGDVRGAVVGRDASIGTGAKVIGGVRIGAAARVGANAVVIDDVPPGVTVVGAPARPISNRRMD
jgi:serine O-acetyltransferase